MNLLEFCIVACFVFVAHAQNCAKLDVHSFSLFYVILYVIGLLYIV